MDRKIFHLLLFAWMIASCGVQVPNEVQSGRTALQSGNPEPAIPFFRRVADSQPDYVIDTPPLRRTIWSYLGRAYYESGKLREAREALSQALQRDDKDFLARLYSGLILFRETRPRAEKPDNTLALNNILYGLRERVSSKRLVGLVQERGTSFSLTPDIEKELRKAGADEELIDAIRSSSSARAKAAESPAKRGLGEIERSLKEIQSWHASVRKTEYGRAWDSRRLISTRVESSLSMISARRTDRPEFIAGLESLGPTIEEEVERVRKK